MSMKSRIAKVVTDAKKARGGLTVYHELTPDLYSATSKTFVGQVYTALGLRNIADAADSAGFGYPQLSSEYVVSESPDLIVLADTVCCGQKPSTVAARPGWDRVSAVRTGSIVRVHDSIASRWGPRLVDFFRAMSSALARLRHDGRRHDLARTDARPGAFGPLPPGRRPRSGLASGVRFATGDRHQGVQPCHRSPAAPRSDQLAPRRRRSRGVDHLAVSAVAEHTPEVRARGLGPLGVCSAPILPSYVGAWLAICTNEAPA